MTSLRCAIYTRTAAANADGLAAQREVAETYIAREGMVVLPERYDDNGRSGNTADRPALARLLRDAAAGKIDRVVVQQYSRLARCQTVFGELRATLHGHGIKLVSATESLTFEIPPHGKAGAQ